MGTLWDQIPLDQIHNEANDEKGWALNTASWSLSLTVTIPSPTMTPSSSNLIVDTEPNETDVKQNTKVVGVAAKMEKRTMTVQQ